MRNTRPTHPLKKWRKDQRYTPADVSSLIEGRGRHFKDRSVVAVEDGWRHPAYEVCVVIEAITGGTVTVEQLRAWPLRDGVKKRAAG
jgi:hypothetical protein